MSQESRESTFVASQASSGTCPQCGAQAVRGRARPGRSIRYRNLGALPLPADVAVPTCVRCRFEFIDPETRTRLEPLLHDEYRRVLQQRVRLSIDTLMRHTSQRKLELLLGLSQGYLSRLRSGAGHPSPELVSHLALLAHDPQGRLAELERYWAEPPSSPPPAR